MANVLIVEDEKNMQDIIVAYMQRGGHTCFTADDGVERFNGIKKQSDGFDDTGHNDAPSGRLFRLQNGAGNE